MFNTWHSSKTLEEILNSVSEGKLLMRYLGITQVPCVIKSPLRKERHPSFSIYSPDGITIKFKDFATGNYGDIIELLKQLWGMNYHDVLKKIRSDFFEEHKKSSAFMSVASNKKINNAIPEEPTLFPIKHSVVMQNLKVKVRDWQTWDKDYWEQYGVSLKTLKWADVYPISHIIIEKKGNIMSIPADKHAYVYVERKDGIVSYKIYQPYSKDFKWMSKHDSSVWDLWTKLPQNGDYLIITSSRKDSLAIWENTHIPSVSLQGEGYIPKKHVVQQLKDRFKKVFILYDNDFQAEENHGRLLGNKLAKMFDLIQIEIPDEYKSKDSSDLVKNHGRETLKKVIFNLINQ